MAALELRAADPQLGAMLTTYLTDAALPAGARVLEVGCGTGAITRVVATWPPATAWRHAPTRFASISSMIPGWRGACRRWCARGRSSDRVRPQPRLRGDPRGWLHAAQLGRPGSERARGFQPRRSGRGGGAEGRSSPPHRQWRVLRAHRVPESRGPKITVRRSGECQPRAAARLAGVHTPCSEL